MASGLLFGLAGLLAGCGNSSSNSGNNQTAAPVFSPGGGTYTTSQTVTISSATAGAVLYCTTDGTTPTTSSAQCAEPTTVYQTEFLQAIAAAPGASASAVASAGYVINLNAVPTPTFNPAGGTYTGTQQVVIGDTLSGANIFYTLDGSTPTANSTLYTGPVSISQSETLNAIAGATGYTNSAVAGATYVIQAVLPAPAITSIAPSSTTAGGAAFTLTVNGTNFVSGANVLWNGTALTTSYVSATQLTAAVPAGLIALAGSANVTVATPTGVSPASAFTINAAAPAVTNVAPSSGSAGTSITISGNNFANASAVNFGTTPAASFAVTSASSITAAAPTGSGTVDVTITTAGGTSVASAVDQFTYVLAAPAVTGIAPSSGTTAGGTSVIIAGTNFTGATAVDFGATAASFTVTSANSIVAVSPAGTGTQDVRVVTPAGTSATSLSDQFTYSVAAPAVAGLTPASGPAGTSVTIAGTGFTGTTAVDFGATAAVNFTVTSANSITATSPAGTGTQDVRVITAAGTSATTPLDQFTYTVAAPAVTGLTPASGPAGTSVTITGTNFTGATGIAFGAIAATSFTVNSANSITAVAPTGTGTVDVTVNAPGGTSAVSAGDRFSFTVSAPAVTGINPSSGATTGDTTVTITGTNLTGATAVNFGTTPAASFLVTSATSISAVSPAGTGTVDVRVVNASGASTTSSADLFTYSAVAPQVASLSPATGAIGATVIITGTNFGPTQGSSTITFSGITATSTYWSNTAIIVSVPAGATTGAVLVKVNGVTSNSETFVIPAPTVTGISPTNGTSAGGTSVTLTGTNFTGATSVKFGNTAATFTVASATTMTAVSPAGTGTVDVTVTNSYGTSATSAADRFTYALPTPTVTAISPASGAAAGGTSVTITGTNLTGATAVNFGATPATSVVVISATSITAISPAGAGTVDVTVVTPNGTSATSAVDEFTYAAPLPTVTSLNPASGPIGSTVVISGTNFGVTQGSSTVSFSGVVATAINSWSNTSISAVVPAAATTGPVVVTVGGAASTNNPTFTISGGLSGTVASGGGASVVPVVPVVSTVQLYAAGTSGYGQSPTPVGNSVQTDSNGNFSIPYECSALAAPGDQLFLVATSSTSSSVKLMAPLGSCSGVSSLGASVTVNEVTTIAAAYALSGFAAINTSGGINIGAPGVITTAATTCNAANGWKSNGPNTCNYLGLVNAFNTALNLVNVAQGTVWAAPTTANWHTAGATVTGVTPAYTSATVQYLNDSSIPTARINALADMLATCVQNLGSGCAGLFSAASTTTVPADTLQAALNIALNPGNNVATLLGLVPASNPPYATTGLVLSGAGAPADLTLALTFTGAGLGLPPGTSANATIGGTSYSGVGPSYETGLALDSTGNIWVIGYVGSTTNHNGVDAPLLAGFTNSGAPITPSTVLDISATTATLGGFIPDPTVTAPQVEGLNAIAIDQSGNLWVGDGFHNGEIYKIANSASPSVLAGPFVNSSSATVDNLAIDTTGNIWVGNNISVPLQELSNTGTEIALADAGIGTNGQGYLLFDSNANLWAYTPVDNTTQAADIDQINTLNGAVLFSAFSAAAPAANTPPSISLVSDGAGNVYGCADSSSNLDQFRAGTWVNSANAPTIASGRTCGDQLVIDGQGRLFAVSNNQNQAVDEFTTTGTLISPASTGYTGTSSTESVTLNSNYFNLGFNEGNVIAAIDGSGNLWVINQTTAGGTSGDALVEYVGIGAPVVTPTSVALTNGSLGARP